MPSEQQSIDNASNAAHVCFSKYITTIEYTALVVSRADAIDNGAKAKDEEAAKMLQSSIDIAKYEIANNLVDAHIIRDENTVINVMETTVVDHSIKTTKLADIYTK